MKKKISLIASVSLITSGMTFSSIMNKPYNIIVPILCIISGSVLLSFLVIDLFIEKESSFKELIYLMNQTLNSSKELEKIVDENNNKILNVAENLISSVEAIDNSIGLKSEYIVSKLHAAQCEVSKIVDNNVTKFASEFESFAKNAEYNEKETRDILVKADELNRELLIKSIKDLENSLNQNHNDVFNRVSEFEKEVIKGMSESAKIIHSEIVDSTQKSNENRSYIKEELLNELSLQRNLTEDIKRSISKVECLPKIMHETSDKIVDKIDENLDKNKSLLEGLTDDLFANSQKLNKNINKSMNSALDTMNENTEDMVEEIKYLADQYNEFKKYTEALLERMTYITQTDLEVMKGILDGNITK